MITNPCSNEKPFRERRLAVSLTVVIGLTLALLADIHAQLPRVQFGSSVEIGIAGKVGDVNLQPLPGTTVILRDEAGGVVRKVVAGSGGEYLFDCIDDGRYQIEFALEGFLTSRVDVVYRYPSALNVDQVLNLDMNPHNGQRFIVRVMDAATGRPIQGASVFFDGSEGITDACGQTWWNPDRQNVQIRVRKDGYVEVTHETAVQRAVGKFTVSLAPDRKP